MFLNWNLTKESDGTVLATGLDTFLVPAGSVVTRTVSPVTDFVGQVRITFIGYYSGTEKAAAYQVFYTQQENVSVPGPPSGGASSPGAGSTTTPVVTPAEASLKFIEFQDKLEFKAGESREINLIVKNDGGLDLSGMYLTLDGIDMSWYTVKPAFVNVLMGEIKTFIINITVPYDVEKTKTYGFDYNVKNNLGQSFKKAADLKVYSVKDSLIKEIEELEKEISILKYTIKDAEDRGVYVGRAKTILSLADEKTKLAKSEVKDNQFDMARDDIDSARKYIQDVKDELFKLGIPLLEAPKPNFFVQYWVWIVSWILVGLIIILFTLMYLHVSRIQGVEYKHGSKEQISREVKLMNTKLEMMNEELKKGELTRKLYDNRRQDVLDSLKNLKMELNGNVDREPLYVQEARKAIKQAKNRGYKEEDVVDRFVKMGWDKDVVLKLYGDEVV
jgi:hypothetical protein